MHIKLYFLIFLFLISSGSLSYQIYLYVGIILGEKQLLNLKELIYQFGVSSVILWV